MYILQKFKDRLQGCGKCNGFNYKKQISVNIFSLTTNLSKPNPKNITNPQSIRGNLPPLQQPPIPLIYKPPMWQIGCNTTNNLPHHQNSTMPLP